MIMSPIDRTEGANVMCLFSLHIQKRGEYSERDKNRCEFYREPWMRMIGQSGMWHKLTEIFIGLFCVWRQCDCKSPEMAHRYLGHWTATQKEIVCVCVWERERKGQKRSMHLTKYATLTCQAKNRQRPSKYMLGTWMYEFKWTKPHMVQQQLNSGLVFSHSIPERNEVPANKLVILIKYWSNRNE